MENQMEEGEVAEEEEVPAPLPPNRRMSRAYEFHNIINFSSFQILLMYQFRNRRKLSTRTNHTAPSSLPPSSISSSSSAPSSSAPSSSTPSSSFTPSFSPINNEPPTRRYRGKHNLAAFNAARSKRNKNKNNDNNDDNENKENTDNNTNNNKNKNKNKMTKYSKSNSNNNNNNTNNYDNNNDDMEEENENEDGNENEENESGEEGGESEIKNGRKREKKRYSLVKKREDDEVDTYDVTLVCDWCINQVTFPLEKLRILSMLKELKHERKEEEKKEEKRRRYRK